VDYYLVWTGKLSPIVMKNPKDERESLHFFRMDQARPVAACADCYEKQEVKDELERAFREVPRTEITEDEDEE